MVDACISNMIKEKETPQSLITSLNLLKRCSQQFIDEDIEKEEPLKKRMKKDYKEKPKKQEIKEEYFEQCDDVPVKNEKEEEEEATSIISNDPSDNSLSASPTEEPIWDTNPTFDSDPSPLLVETKTQDSENGMSSQPGNNSEQVFASPPRTLMGPLTSCQPQQCPRTLADPLTSSARQDPLSLILSGPAILEMQNKSNLHSTKSASMPFRRQ